MCARGTLGYELRFGALVRRSNGGRRLCSGGLLARARGCRVGRLFGQPKRSQSCGLFPNRPRLRLIGRPRFLGIVSRFLCLLEPCFGLIAFLGMIRQCCLLVGREMTRSALVERGAPSSIRRLWRRSRGLFGLFTAG